MAGTEIIRRGIERVTIDVEERETMEIHDMVMEDNQTNGAELGLLNVASRTMSETSINTICPPPTKLSSISTTNENNNRVGINRSHDEVPGDSSTDGTFEDARKSGGISFEAFAKVGIASPVEKEQVEKMKALNPWHVSSNSDGSSQVGSKQGFRTPLSSSGILPVPVPSVVPTAEATNASTLYFTAEHGAALIMEKFAIYRKQFPSAQLLIRNWGVRHLPRKSELKNMNRIKYVFKPVRSSVSKINDIEVPNTLLKNAEVAVYKTNDLSDPRNLAMVCFYVEDYSLTGCAVITKGISVVVVCGKRKLINRYNQFILGHKKWGEGKIKAEDNDIKDKSVNECVLLWKGHVAKPSFDRFSVHKCETEAAARKVFLDAGVTQYWDLAVQGQI